MSYAAKETAFLEIAPEASAKAVRKRTPRILKDRVETPADMGPFALNEVHQIDCISAMRQLPDASVDVAIADPPYNASKGNN